jgi:hypothetical protein
MKKLRFTVGLIVLCVFITSLTILFGFTNFPNGITSFGIPIMGDGIPVLFDRTQSNIYWYVDGKSGSDSNDGKTPQTPLDTIAAAITLANAAIDWAGTPWGPRHTIIIAPGKYAENLTSLPYGCNMIGLGDAFDLNGERGVVIKPASGSPVDCTSVINMRIENICFESPDTSDVFEADNFNRNVIVNCVFTGLPGGTPTSTTALNIVKDMTGNRITNCVFQVTVDGIYIDTDNANSKQASGNIIEYCYIRGCTSQGIYFEANTVPSYTQINHCVIGDGGTTLAMGLDDDTGLVNVSWTTFTATACDPASGDSDSKYNGCYLNGGLIT